MYQLTAQKNGLRLQADLESEMRVYADRTELAQVFSNLVSNALKFSDTGTVCITAKRCQGQAVVKVVDQGQGISEQDLPYIFDEFYQAQDTSFGKPPQGIGLGLSIAKKIVTAHQGTIQVKSRVGKGSTFTVTLPCP
jgi:two-component system sensor histidine kinase BaeS